MALVLGESELARHEVRVREVAARTDRDVPIDSLVEHLRALIARSAHAADNCDPTASACGAVGAGGGVADAGRGSAGAGGGVAAGSGSSEDVGPVAQQMAQTSLQES